MIPHIDKKNYIGQKYHISMKLEEKYNEEQYNDINKKFMITAY